MKKSDRTSDLALVKSYMQVGTTIEKIAEATGMNRFLVQDMVYVLRLSQEDQQRFLDGKLSFKDVDSMVRAMEIPERRVAERRVRDRRVS